MVKMYIFLLRYAIFNRFIFYTMYSQHIYKFEKHEFVIKSYFYSTYTYRLKIVILQYVVNVF